MKTNAIETFYKDGYLRQMPRKKELRIQVLQKICEGFPKQEAYTEAEINSYLKEVCDDFVEVRRYLIDYKLLKRKIDGSAYYPYNKNEV